MMTMKKHQSESKIKNQKSTKFLYKNHNNFQSWVEYNDVTASWKGSNGSNAKSKK